MNIPTDEQLVEMDVEQIRIHLYTALQLRHNANKNNQFKKSQELGDLILKCRELLEMDEIIEKCT